MNYIFSSREKRRKRKIKKLITFVFYASIVTAAFYYVELETQLISETISYLYNLNSSINE